MENSPFAKVLCTWQPLCWHLVETAIGSIYSQVVRKVHLLQFQLLTPYVHFQVSSFCYPRLNQPEKMDLGQLEPVSEGTLPLQ